MRFILKKIFIFILACFSVSAFPHVLLENQEAMSDSYFKSIFKVTHGCDGSPTRQLIVEIPEGFKGAKPMVKSGWDLTVQKSKLDKSYISHKKTITEDVRRIEWSGGPLASAYYDEFVIVGQVPDVPGNLYWKVTQVCELGKLEWVEIPSLGKSVKDYKFPAAVLKVLPLPDQHDQHKH